MTLEDSKSTVVVLFLQIIIDLGNNYELLIITRNIKLYYLSIHLGRNMNGILINYFFIYFNN